LQDEQRPGAPGIIPGHDFSAPPLQPFIVGERGLTSALPPGSLWPHKLAPPQATFAVVNRPVVDTLAQQAARARLLLVQAPAGFGKTSLLRILDERRRSTGQHVAWLTLDSADNDPQRFLGYLEAALQRASDAAGLPVQASDAERIGEGVTLEAVLARVALLTQGPAMLSLTLDDFEVIDSEAVTGIVRDLLRLAPQNCRFSIGCRQAPNLPLSRLRSLGQVLDVGVDQLRLSVTEASQMLANILGETPQADTVSRLQQRTEGWAAALQLAALALGKRLDVEQYVDSFGATTSDLGGYLTEEVLARQPQDIRNLLMKSSILDALCPELCDEVCGIANSAELLRRIQHDNLFLFPLDATGQWFRYHKLFAQFLQQELREQHAGLQPELHKRAAAWYAQRGNKTSAMEHALLSGDQHYAGSLGDEYAANLAASGRLVTVIGWAERLPREVLDLNLRLKVYYAVSLVATFQHRKATPLLEELGHPEVTGRLDPETHGILMFGVCLQLLLQDRFDEALATAERSIGQLDGTQPLPLHALMNTRAVCLLHLHRYSEVEDQQARVRGLAAGISTYGLVYAECLLGISELAQGRLRSATAVFAAGLSTATGEASANSAPAAMASACLADACYEAGELEQAGSLLQRHLSTIAHMGITDIVLQAHVVHARLAYWQGGYEQACQRLNDLKRLGYERDLPRVVGAAWAEQCRMALLQDDIPSATRYAQMAETQAPYTSLWEESSATLRARLLIAQGKGREATSLLQAEIRQADTQGRRRYVLKLGLLLALAQQRARQATEALKTLAAAVELGARESFLGVFIDEGPALALLLRELRATRELAEPSKAFVDRLLPIMEGATVGAAAEQDADDPQQRLSRREFEVLALIAEGLSNQAITEKLSLSLATVKSHVANIMAKLGAKSRSEAVAIARRRNLLNA